MHNKGFVADAHVHFRLLVDVVEVEGGVVGRALRLVRRSRNHETSAKHCPGSVVADAGRRQLEGVDDDVAVLVDGQEFLGPEDLFADGVAFAERRVEVVGARRVDFGAENDLKRSSN